MKKITHFMMAAAVMLASFSFVACGKDDEKENKYEESNSYAIYHEGHALAAGETITITPSEEQRQLMDVEADIYMYNKTENTLNTCFKVELAEGPESMKNEAPVCYGVCQTQQLPYIHEPISLAPGLDSKPIQVHVYMDMHETHTGTYRITVGEGTSLANPQVCYIKFNW